MNIKKLLAEVEASGLRGRFYEDLIAMLAAEAELCYPERIHPGPAYDAAMKRLSMVVQAKGKIHAFYNLNCRWGVVPDARGDGPVEIRDVGFFNDLFRELEVSPDVRQRVVEIVESALERVLGIKSECQYGNQYGNKASETGV